MSRAPHVFLSYAHHPDGHGERYLELAQQLRSDGVNIRFDQFDPDPHAGWPTWTHVEVEAADLVLLGSSQPWRRRLDGRLDEHGGRGVRFEGRLIYNLAFEADSLDLFRPIVIDGDDPKKVVPLVFADGTELYYPSQYAEILSVARGVAPQSPGPVTTSPILQPIEFEFTVVGNDALADALGASRDPNAARVVVGDARNLPRVAAAEDRAVVDIAGLNLDDAKVREHVVARARSARRRLQRHWWLTSGRDLLLASAIALAWPALAARHAHLVQPGALVAIFAGLVASGSLFLSAIGAGLSGGEALLPLHRIAIIDAWRYLRRSAWRARGSTDRGERARATAVYFGAIAVAWLIYFASVRGASTEVMSIALEYGVAVGLGVVSTVAAMRGGLGWLASGACILAAAAMPRLMSKWNAIVTLGDAWIFAVGTPDIHAPATWVATGPSMLPISAMAGVLVVFVPLWLLNERPLVQHLRRVALVAVAVLTVGAVQ